MIVSYSSVRRFALVNGLCGVIFSIVGLFTKRFMFNVGVLELGSGTVETAIKAMIFVGIIASIVGILFDLITAHLFLREIFNRVIVRLVFAALVVSSAAFVASFSITFNKYDEIYACGGYSFWFQIIASILVIQMTVIYGIATHQDL